MSLTVVCPGCNYAWLIGIYLCPRCGTTLVK
jgi:transposase